MNKYDPIIDAKFAEIEQFLDASVKRYSIGMCGWPLRWGMRLSEIRGGEGQLLKRGAGQVNRKGNRYAIYKTRI